MTMTAAQEEAESLPTTEHVKEKEKAASKPQDSLDEVKDGVSSAEKSADKPEPDSWEYFVAPRHGLGEQVGRWMDGHVDVWMSG